MIVGKKVKLRGIELTDVEKIVKWRNDPSIMQHFLEAAPLSYAQQMDWLDDPKRKAEFNWIISVEGLVDGTHVEDIAVGTVGIYNIDRRNRKCEWGRLILDPAYHGRGYGIETELLVYQYAFEHLNMNKVYGEAFAHNTHILAIHDKTGNKQDGVLRQHVYRNGRYHDLVAVSILAEDYFRLKDEGRYGKYLA